ncbi:MAG: chromate efflux transporter [Chloroflexota bacterium]|nr:chromate efflux transporter [Chloroflexota bacterium]
MSRPSSPLEVFLVALRLGLTSFGGPIAHLGYFRSEYVVRRRWVDEMTYADIVALCQSLPGPTSSEVGIAIGLLRAGPLGAFLAWLGFTLPSAVLMVIFAYTLDRLGGALVPVVRVLELVALAVVAFAVWRMARALARDARRGTIALAATALAVAWHDQYAQVAIILLAGIAGRILLPAPAVATRVAQAVPIGRTVAIACGMLYVVLLVALPVAGVTFASGELRLFDAFYRSGAFVFGGGHVVLPLLQNEVVPSGWVTQDQFLAGYGAAQAVPGPLFTFAAYLGTVIAPSPCSNPLVICDLFTVWPPNGLVGATIALVGIFLPAFLVVFAALPSWGALRTRPWAQSALAGVNAGVVGLLLAALIGLVVAAIASLR